MTEIRRTRTPSVGMEAALLSSAADLLETEGPEGLSVRKIAAAAGVAPMGVYNHFESKFGIVEALFIQGFERLRDATESRRPVRTQDRRRRRCRPDGGLQPLRVEVRDRRGPLHPGLRAAP